MAAISSIVLNDGQGTPVAHTFSPASIKGDVAQWYDRVTGIAVGYPAMSMSLRNPLAKGARVYKATIRIARPTLEVTSPNTGTGIQPAPTKAYDCMFIGDFLLPERSLKADRADLFAYVKNVMANATLKTLVEDLENVY